ncbi:MAG: hypothetical protein JSR58_05995 [Verrucomicrobia bacterium]|nr:hypothetical protein [Verrucomicrobiota bacterium]
MANSTTIAPNYVPYTHLPHVDHAILINRRVQFSQLFFPSRGWDSPKLNALYYQSENSCILLLTKSLNTLKIGYSGDPFHKICPLAFYQETVDVTPELFAAVCECGDKIVGFPEVVAIHIEFLGNPGFAVPSNLLLELECLIRKSSSSLKLPLCTLSTLPNTWSASAKHPNWKGITFALNNPPLKVWVHEKNPEAFGSARDFLRDNMLEVIGKIRELFPKIQIAFRQNQGEPADRFVARSTRDLSTHYQSITEYLDVLDDKLSEWESLKPEDVTSAVSTTLQAQLSVHIDATEVWEAIKKDTLTAHVNNLRLSINREYLDKTSMPKSGSQLERLARQYRAYVNRALDLQIQLHSTSNMPHFLAARDPQLDKQTVNRSLERYALTFQDWIEKSNLGSLTPSQEVIQLNRWKQQLWDCLDYLMNQTIGYLDSKIDLWGDDSLFNDYVNLMKETLKCFKGIIKDTQSLTPIQKREKIKEIETMENSLNHFNQRINQQNSKPYGLFKRITHSGSFIYGINELPSNTQANPDPNNRLDEVHLPIDYV